MKFRSPEVRASPRTSPAANSTSPTLQPQPWAAAGTHRKHLLFVGALGLSHFKGSLCELQRQRKICSVASGVTGRWREGISSWIQLLVLAPASELPLENRAGGKYKCGKYLKNKEGLVPPLPLRKTELGMTQSRHGVSLRKIAEMSCETAQSLVQRSKDQAECSGVKEEFGCSGLISHPARSQGTLSKAHPEGLSSGKHWELLVPGHGRAGAPELQTEEGNCSCSSPAICERVFLFSQSPAKPPLCTGRGSHAEGEGRGQLICRSSCKRLKGFLTKLYHLLRVDPKIQNLLLTILHP